MASQSKAGGWVFGLGESISELLEGAEVLATATAEIDQSKASEGERVRLWSQSFPVSNGEWVDAGHLGVLARIGVYCVGIWAETEAGERMGDLK